MYLTNTQVSVKIFENFLLQDQVPYELISDSTIMYTLNFIKLIGLFWNLIEAEELFVSIALSNYQSNPWIGRLEPDR
jgi:hypothetical protein